MIEEQETVVRRKYGPDLARAAGGDESRRAETLDQMAKHRAREALANELARRRIEEWSLEKVRI